MEGRKVIIYKDNLSFPEKSLILVDEKDNIIGYKAKERCHQGEGLLHRAFSIFILNDKKQLLIQKRSNKKTLWPMYWSNSVCSHPFQGEKIEDAAERRLKEELGLETRVKYVFKFQYKARFGEIGVEHEICYVFMGIGDGNIRPNIKEVAEWEYIDLETLNNNIAMQSNKYTPWFKLEWERIQKEGYIKIIRS